MTQFDHCFWRVWFANGLPSQITLIPNHLSNDMDINHLSNDMDTKATRMSTDLQIQSDLLNPIGHSIDWKIGVSAWLTMVYSKLKWICLNILLFTIFTEAASLRTGPCDLFLTIQVSRSLKLTHSTIILSFIFTNLSIISSFY